ncbi:hypothetical protein GCM10027169_38550 [Gordonia jinhuaensis]
MTGRLDATHQTGIGERAEHVVDGLQRHIRKFFSRCAIQRVGVGVWMKIDSMQHRDPRAGHTEISCTQPVGVLRCGSHGFSMAVNLDSFRTLVESRPLRRQPPRTIRAGIRQFRTADSTGNAILTLFQTDGV